MKAIVTLAAGLILVSATFAQTSRRSEVKENNETNNTSRRTESVSTDRSTPSERATNSRTEQTNTNRRNAESTTTERKPEVSTNQGAQQPNSGDNRRNSESTTSERRTEVRPNQGAQQPSPSVQQPSQGVQDRSSVTNRRNTTEQGRDNNNYNNNSTQKSNSNRTYDNNRREPSGNQQVIVQDNSRRAEPRHKVVVRQSYRPEPVEVRRVKHPYRAPVRAEVIWTVDLSRRYEVYYPHYRPYRYHVGMRLATVSAYDAYDFVGEIARVYGRVAESYYSWETDEYFLYLGDYYPYHDFSVVIPGREARDFSRRPERFFNRQYIEVTGLITRYDGKPEMVIKRSSQIGVY